MSEATIDLTKLKTPFPAADIEWRLAQCGANGEKIWAKVLAYVTSRAIQDRLDQVVGAENWEPKYEFIYGKDGLTSGIVCRLSIRCGPNGTWVTKEDGAEQTDIESFKGGISSALKRAGSAWGIGRYLYDLDSGFADIVKSGTAGSHWGKTKDNKQFNWLPPQLPSWALPEKTDAPTDEKPKTEVDQKLANKTNSPPAVTPNEPGKTPPATTVKGVTPKQRAMIWARVRGMGYDETQAREFLIAHSGKEHSEDWNRKDFDHLLNVVTKFEKENTKAETQGDAYEGH